MCGGSIFRSFAQVTYDDFSGSQEMATYFSRDLDSQQDPEYANYYINTARMSPGYLSIFILDSELFEFVLQNIRLTSFITPAP